MEMDPSALFGTLFGGDRFRDLIGEISLVKGGPQGVETHVTGGEKGFDGAAADFASTMDVVMTDEERAEMEAEGVNVGAAAAGATGADGLPAHATAAAADPVASKTSTQGVRAEDVPDHQTPPSAVPHARTSTDAPAHAHEPHNGHMTLHAGESGSSNAAASTSASGTSTPPTGKKGTGKAKLSAEQKAKLAALDAEKDKAREERCVGNPRTDAAPWS